MLNPEILNKNIVFVCDCGNADQKKINLFHKYTFKTDSKGYRKAIRVNARMCSVCKSTITMSEAFELLKQKSRQDEGAEVESN